MIVATLSAPTLRDGLRAAAHPPSPFAPALLWAVPVAASVAYLSTHIPTAGLLALVLTLLGVTYMLQLVAASRAASAERSLAATTSSPACSARCSSATRSPPATPPRWPSTRRTSPQAAGLDEETLPRRARRRA